MQRSLQSDTTLSHYRIFSRLSAGGMGEVYLAQDTKLDRTIALKILPAELASNRDRMRRFVQEAQAAAALNPNIAHIYEIGGSLFLIYYKDPSEELTKPHSFFMKTYRRGAT